MPHSTSGAIENLKVDCEGAEGRAKGWGWGEW